jgi:hypothetical protein
MRVPVLRDGIHPVAPHGQMLPRAGSTTDHLLDPLNFVSIAAAASADSDERGHPSGQV